MRKYIPIFSLGIVLASCTVNPSRILGEYQSSCILHNKPDLLLKLNKDKTFEYQLAYLDEIITGNWRIIDNEIILESDYFLNEYTEKKFPDTPKELTPKYKYTEREEKDVYIFRRNKLMVMEKEGIKRGCHLFKMKLP